MHVNSMTGYASAQSQSVAVARAVMWNSRLVILDEPTAALGVAQTEQVLQLVSRLAEQGLAVVLISHDLPLVTWACERIVVMQGGSIVDHFDTESLGRDEIRHPYTKKMWGDTAVDTAEGNR